jgi:hypothetical protein
MSKPSKYLSMTFATFPQADTHDAQAWTTLLRHRCGWRHYRVAVYHVTTLLAADRWDVGSKKQAQAQRRQIGGISKREHS